MKIKLNKVGLIVYQQDYMENFVWSNTKLKWMAPFPSLLHFIPFHFVKKNKDIMQTWGSFLKKPQNNPVSWGCCDYEIQKNLIWGFSLKAGRANYNDCN